MPSEEPGAATLPSAVHEWLARAASRTAGLSGPDPRDSSERRRYARRLSDLLAEEFTAPGPASCLVSSYRVTGPVGRVDLLRYSSLDAPYPRPAQLWMHGGGFAAGSIYEQVNDRLLRSRAAATGCDILALEYSLAPEHPYPTALNEAFAALLWMGENADGLGIDPRRIGVGGNSAGGNLAAALSLLARDRGCTLIRHQLLEVPLVGLDERDESMQLYSHGYGLDDPGDLILAYAGAGYDPADPYLLPSSGSVEGLPRTTVMTAEFDPLRDAAERYAQRAADAGVPTMLIRGHGHIHASSSSTRTFGGARRWQRRAASELRECLASLTSPEPVS